MGASWEQQAHLNLSKFHLLTTFKVVHWDGLLQGQQLSTLASWSFSQGWGSR